MTKRTAVYLIATKTQLENQFETDLHFVEVEYSNNQNLIKEVTEKIKLCENLAIDKYKRYTEITIVSRL